MNKKEYIKLLDNAELQYKFALALNTLYNTNHKIHGRLPVLPYLTHFTYGKHWADKNELTLDEKQEKDAVMLIEHSTVYLMAVQMDTVLEKSINNRFKHTNSEIKSASCIIRLIRNSFAHNPFAPIWIIDRSYKNQVYTVGKINLDTKKVDGKPVRRLDYGGPLALLWLSQFIKKII